VGDRLFLRSTSGVRTHKAVVPQFESKHAFSVPRQGAGGTERPLQNRAATVRVAFVEAARFLGGQLFVSFINEIDTLPYGMYGAVDAVRRTLLI
jgi:hypothetical protein